jgi:hypothetical protein
VSRINDGDAPPQARRERRTREREVVEGFTLAELDQLPVLVPGAALARGAVYCDVTDPRHPVFRADDTLSRVPHGHYFVPRLGVPFAHWARLIDDRDRG